MTIGELLDLCDLYVATENKLAKCEPFSMIKVMNSVEIEKKIRELVGHYLIKDYHVTVKRGDVILWLPDICKGSPFNKLVDEVYGALDDSIRISIIYPNNGKKVSEFIRENMEEIKRMKLI